MGVINEFDRMAWLGRQDVPVLKTVVKKGNVMSLINMVDRLNADNNQTTELERLIRFSRTTVEKIELIAAGKDPSQSIPAKAYLAELKSSPDCHEEED